MKLSTKNYNNKFNLIKNNDIVDISNQRISNNTAGATVIIPHVCNNVDVYGAGFAAYISERFPIAKNNFHLLGKQNKLGKVQFVTVKTNNNTNNSIIIANMIAQNGTISKSNTRPLNYIALTYCLMEVKSYILQLQKNNQYEKIEIHAPKFGSGLAGGDWKIISEIINDAWNNIPVFIYEKK